MIKNGRYGLYHGKKFEISEDADDNMVILTEDISLIDNTFEDLYDSGMYTKQIMPKDLDKLYSIVTVGYIEGIKVYVRGEREEHYIVGTGNESDARMLGLERSDKYGYEGAVSKNRISIKEEKTSLME